MDRAEKDEGVADIIRQIVDALAAERAIARYRSLRQSFDETGENYDTREDVQLGS